MHGTVLQKIGRVIVNLAANPEYIPRCISHNLFDGKTPLELEIPWFSYSAIDFLASYVQPYMRVFEYGSGGSTLFFARRAGAVLSVEDNAQWYGRVRERVAKKGLKNVTIKHCPFDFKKAAGFEGSDYLNAIPEETFDIIVVDGSEEWTQVRPICFKLAESRVKPGGIIVVDDSWRYPVLRQQHRAQRFQVFRSVGPCRPGVTSTDVFFY